LQETSVQLVDTGHPLSGVNDRSIPFFRTVAASPALIARARELAFELQRTLTEELERDPVFEGDATLLAAFFIAGYTAVLMETARRRIAEESPSSVTDGHRARLDKLFDALRNGALAPANLRPGGN
jgi:hypothetical protein